MDIRKIPGTALQNQATGATIYTPPAGEALLRAKLANWETFIHEETAIDVLVRMAVAHYQFEAIHPFKDGNGRTGRALALWELYRRGFDSHHIFSVDEYYWEDRPGYYAALGAVRTAGEDLTGWLEYCAEGVHKTLDQVWLRVQSFNLKSPTKLKLRPKQERLLKLLRDHGSMTPSALWKALAVSKQGAMDLLRPLLEAGVVEKLGGKKTGSYSLKQT